MIKIKQFIFGIKKQGERLNAPRFITTFPMVRIDYNKWCKELNVSILYQR